MDHLAATGHLCHDHGSSGSSQDNDHSTRHEQQRATKDLEQQQQQHKHHHQISTLTQCQHLNQPLQLVSRSIMSNLGSSLYLQSWNSYYGGSKDNQWKNVWSDNGLCCCYCCLSSHLLSWRLWQTSGVSSSWASSLIHQHLLHLFDTWKITNTSSDIHYYEGKVAVRHWNDSMPMRRVADTVLDDVGCPTKDIQWPSPLFEKLFDLVNATTGKWTVLHQVSRNSHCWYDHLERCIKHVMVQLAMALDWNDSGWRTTRMM